MQFIPLTKGSVAIVDDEDFEELNKYNWYCSGGYAVRGCPRKKHMSRIVSNAPEGFEVDHINHDKLDNRKKNLRICTTQQNRWNRIAYRCNTSGYKGVYKEGNKWSAKIRYNNVLMNIGFFSIKEEAAKAYNKKAQELFGNFAYINNCI